MRWGELALSCDVSRCAVLPSWAGHGFRVQSLFRMSQYGSGITPAQRQFSPNFPGPSPYTSGMTDLPPAPDLELRLVRYFIAVAEQRHFGRAAEALHITQPSLSRQVRRLEEQMGARLLDRTPQGTRLTEAGEV